MYLSAALLAQPSLHGTARLRKHTQHQVRTTQVVCAAHSPGSPPCKRSLNRSESMDIATALDCTARHGTARPSRHGAARHGQLALGSAAKPISHWQQGTHADARRPHCALPVERAFPSPEYRVRRRDRRDANLQRQIISNRIDNSGGVQMLQQT